MIVFNYMGVPSNRGLDQRLYGLSGVGNVPGGLWVVLDLEWSLRTPPVKFCKNHLISPSLILSFSSFFGLCDNFFQPHLHLSLLLGSGDGCLAYFSFVFRML